MSLILSSMVSFYLSLSQSSSASTTKSHTFWSPSLRQCRNLQTALSPIVSSSYLPTSYITQKQIEIPTSPVYILNPCLLQPWVSNFVFPLRQKHDFGFGLQEKQSPPVQEGLGAFQKLPMVMPSIDLYASALRKSKRVQPTKGYLILYLVVFVYTLTSSNSLTESLSIFGLRHC